MNVIHLHYLFPNCDFNFALTYYYLPYLHTILCTSNLKLEGFDKALVCKESIDKNEKVKLSVTLSGWSSTFHFSRGLEVQSPITEEIKFYVCQTP